LQVPVCCTLPRQLLPLLLQQPILLLLLALLCCLLLLLLHCKRYGAQVWHAVESWL
jgi:hypothetical protein